MKDVDGPVLRSVELLYAD